MCIRDSSGGDNSSSNDGAHEFSDFVTIAADERSNAILVYGTKEDIDEIGIMVESLDQPLPLARIDTIFVMVDLTEQNQRGIDALFGGLEWSKYARGDAGDKAFGDPETEEIEVMSDPGPDGVPGTSDDVTSKEKIFSPQNTLNGVWVCQYLIPRCLSNCRTGS